MKLTIELTFYTIWGTTFIIQLIFFLQILISQIFLALSLTMKKVAIIGGGLSGLCALKHLLPCADIQSVIFEQRNSIGGQWLYEDVHGESNEIFSSMYKNLRYTSGE